MKRNSLLLFVLLYVGHLYGQVPEQVDAIGLSTHHRPFVEVNWQGKAYYYLPEANLFVDKIENVAGDLISVARGGAYGALSKAGRILADFVYDDITLATDYNGQWYDGIPYNYQFVIMKKDGKYGAIDENGKVISEPLYEDVQVLNRDLMGIQAGGKWGWISARDGSMLQEPIYDRVNKSYIVNDAVTIYSGDKEGLAKADGTVIIPPQYAFLCYFYTKSQLFVEFSENRRSGLMDSTGKQVLEPTYEKVASLGNTDLIKVQEGGLYGCINGKGQLVVPINYTEIGSFVKGLSVVQKEGRYGVVDEYGKQVIPLAYDVVEFRNVLGEKVWDESAQIAPPMPYGTKPTEALLREREKRQEIAVRPYHIYLRTGNSSGICDWFGRELIPTGNYAAISAFLVDEKTYFKVLTDSLYGIYNDRGREILPMRYRHRSDQLYAGNGYREPTDGHTPLPLIPVHDLQRVGLFDLEAGKFVIPVDDQEISWAGKGYLQVRRKDKEGSYQTTTALYDRTGKVIMDYREDIYSYELLTDSLLLEERADRGLRLIDLGGHTVYENPEWRENNFRYGRNVPVNKNPDAVPFESGLMKVVTNAQNLFIDRKGKERRFEGYDYVGSFYKNRAFALKKEAENRYRIGMIDTAGKVLIPLALDAVENVYDHPDLLMARQGKQYGLLTWAGQYLLPPEYDYISIGRSGGYVEITKEGKKGLAKLDGTIMVEPIYDDLKRSSDDVDSIWPLLVKYGEWYRLLGKDGEFYPIKASRKTGY